MTDLDYNQMRKLVKDVARSVSNGYPPYVTADDTEGHLWVHMYERKAWFAQVVEEGDGWEARIGSVLRKEANNYCAKEKADAEGYSPEDIYRYPLSKIRLLLDDVFSYEDWQSFGLHGDGQPVAKIQANQTGDRIAELVDVKSAIEAMDDETYNLLVWHYKYQYTMPMLAEEFGITVEAVKKRAQRALTALQKQLGRKDYSDESSASGGRTVRSNAAHRAAVSTQYDG